MEKIISRPYDQQGEESHKRVFGDRGLPPYMIAQEDPKTADVNAEKAGDHE
jgi:hypothetical protein